MTAGAENPTGAFMASNAHYIYWRNVMSDPGSGTAEYGEDYDLSMIYSEKTGIGHYRKTIEALRMPGDWGKYQPLQYRHFRIHEIKDTTTWNIKTSFDLPKLEGKWSEEKINETIEEDSIRNDLSRMIQIIFEVGKNEQFEDGMKSDFSRAFEYLIKNYQEDAIEILSDFLTSNRIDSDLLCETIRTLGNFKDDKTELSRFQILIFHLSHASPYIRDCASLALYDLESPNAIPYINKAIDREPYESLKRDFKKIISF